MRVCRSACGGSRSAFGCRPVTMSLSISKYYRIDIYFGYYLLSPIERDDFPWAAYMTTLLLLAVVRITLSSKRQNENTASTFIATKLSRRRARKIQQHISADGLLLGDS